MSADKKRMRRLFVMLSLLWSLWGGTESAVANERAFLHDLAQVQQALHVAWGAYQNQFSIQPDATMAQLAAVFPADWQRVDTTDQSVPAQIDGLPGQGPVPCTDGVCYQVPGGGMVFLEPTRAFSGITGDHAVFVLFDPDGRWTGSISDKPDQGHYKAIRIFITATGKIWREDDWQMNLITREGRYSVQPGNVPAWAHPEYWEYQTRWSRELQRELQKVLKRDNTR